MTLPIFNELLLLLLLGFEVLYVCINDYAITYKLSYCIQRPSLDPRPNPRGE